MKLAVPALTERNFFLSLVCISEGGESHSHGESWIPSNDVCSNCYCDVSNIMNIKTTLYAL